MTSEKMLRMMGGAIVLACGLALSAQHTYASVVISTTRVIYKASDKDATIRLYNNGAATALTHVWIDNGDASESPTTIEAPFVVMPSTARIAPDKSQVLRIFGTGQQQPLPEDRESVFWVNVLEVPPPAEAQGTEQNVLQVAYRTRIKLFYRPTGLEGTPAEAPSKLNWRLGREGKVAVLEVRNPTPFHVNLGSAQVSGNGTQAAFDVGDMIAPGESKRFPLKGQIAPTAPIKVRYYAINDWGALTEGDTLLADEDASAP